MGLDEMRIADPSVSRVVGESDILGTLLKLDGAAVLELGCGKAEKTRIVAEQAASVLALEVDEIQLEKNLALPGLDNVRFGHGGAEQIPAGDACFDIVLMFKSLHHVPVEQMDRALSEIERVLKPGGVAYLSEPVYAGDYNAILSLFNDEKNVREAAFDAIRRAVSSKHFELVGQTFFLQPVHFDDFAQFERQTIRVTHMDHQLSPTLFEQVRSTFNGRMTPGGVDYLHPMRVDLLRKVG